MSTILLERNAGGLEVEISYLPVTDILALTCRVGLEQAAVTVEPGKALDAFAHPTIYLSAAQVDMLGIR